MAAREMEKGEDYTPLVQKLRSVTLSVT